MKEGINGGLGSQEAAEPCWHMIACNHGLGFRV